MAINWSESYFVSWKLYSVNKDTWADGDDYSSYVNSISISKDGTDNVPLLETGTVSMDLPIETSFSEGYYRIVAFITQNAISSRYPIATFLMEQTKNDVKVSDTGFYNLGSNTDSVSGRSVLAPAEDTV